MAWNIRDCLLGTINSLVSVRLQFRLISKRSREDELFTAELQDYEVVFRRLSTVVLTT